MPVKRMLADVARLTDRELKALASRGLPPDPAALAGFEFRVFCPSPVTRLTRAQKQIIGFYWRLVGGRRELWGYRTPVVQNGLFEPWRPLPTATNPNRGGWFRAQPAPDLPKDHRHPNALVLNPADGQNPWPDGAFLWRYDLVQVDPGNPDLFLARAYLALGSLRVPAHFLVLERHGESGFGG